MHEVEGATWCEPKRRNGRLRQAEASPVCAQTRGRARARRGRCREHRRRSAEGAEGRGETRRHGACEGRSLSRERRPEALPQLQSALSRCRGRSRITRRFRHAGCESDGHCSTSGGSKGGCPFGACKGGAGGNGGDRPCLPAPVPVCGPASSGQGSLRNG